MKPTVTRIDKRMIHRRNVIRGIISYDIDNLYPDRVRDIVDSSGVAKTCVDLYAKYIMGGGFKDTRFYKLRVNSTGLRLDRLLRKVSKDFAYHAGFTIHVNYNMNAKISSLHFVSFRQCRLTTEDSDHAGKIAVYPDWSDRRIDPEKVDYIDRFNPDPAVVLSQITAAGGIEKYKGQVLYYSADDESYPITSFDPVLEDMQTDSELKFFKFGNATTKFLADHILVTDAIQGRDDEEETKKTADGKSVSRKQAREEEEFIADLEEYQGGRNNGKIFWVQKQHPDQTFDLKKIDIQDNDRLFEFHEQSVRDSIMRKFLIPPVLLLSVPGKLGASTEIIDATRFYNTVTSDERLVMEETFKDIFSAWHEEGANPTGDYSIIPVSAPMTADSVPAQYLPDLTKNERRELVGYPAENTDEAEKPILATTLGVGGTQSMLAVLQDATMELTAKRNTLQVLFGLSEEVTAKLVPDKNTPPQEQSDGSSD